MNMWCRDKDTVQPVMGMYFVLSLGRDVRLDLISAVDGSHQQVQLGEISGSE